MIGAHKIEAKPIAMARREATQSDMAYLGCGLAIERTDVAPALCFRLEDLDGVTDATDPVPTEGFDIAKPGTAKAGISNDNRMTLRGHHLMKTAEELAMGAGAVVAAYARFGLGDEMQTSAFGQERSVELKSNWLRLFATNIRMRRGGAVK